eukprot:scaffold75257_cov63-Phaeocystis_antarctica.AAC.1
MGCPPPEAEQGAHGYPVWLCCKIFVFEKWTAVVHSLRGVHTVNAVYGLTQGWTRPALLGPI